MVARNRGLVAIALALVSCGCASTSSGATRAVDRCIAEDARWVASESRPAEARRIASTRPVSFAVSRSRGPRVERPARIPSIEPSLAHILPGEVLDGSELASPFATGRAAPADHAAIGSALVRLGGTFALEFCAATEPQEADTAGYWDEFHQGRTRDQRLDLSWRWQQDPRTALIGCVGSTRTLDRDLDDAILAADELFVAVGMRFCW